MITLTTQRHPDWKTAMRYFDAYTATSPEFLQAKVPERDLYFYKAGERHVERISAWSRPADKQAEAELAVAAFSRYIGWYTSISTDDRASLMLIPPEKYPDDTPFSRGYIRLGLGSLAQAMISANRPQDVSDALASVDAHYFGADAVNGWIKALRYNFGDNNDKDSDDAVAILRNVKNRDGWTAHVAAFVKKMIEIKAVRTAEQGPPLSTTTINLATRLAAAQQLPTDGL